MAVPLVPSATGDHVAVPAWGFLLLAASLFGAYLVLQENGWVLADWMTLHEVFHDGRHALALPCH